MKLIKLSTVLRAVTSITAVSVILSCVNEEYDLGKDIDMDINLLKGISLPVGDFEKISLMDVLDLEDSEGSMISADENNDLILSFSGDRISADIQMPELTLGDVSGINTEPIEVVFNMGQYSGKNPSSIQGNILYSGVAGKKADGKTDIIIESDLPEQVVDVKSVTLDSELEISFSVNTGAVHLVKGLELTFPDDVYLSKNDTKPYYKISGEHKVTVTEDVEVTHNSPLVFHLNLEKIEVPAGSISNGHVTLDEVLHISADFYISPADFSVIPEKLLIEVDADLKSLSVRSAEVKLDVDEEIEGTEMETGEVPDFLSGEGSCIDLYNPSIRFSVNNTSPFSLDVTADIRPYRTGTDVEAIRLAGDDRVSIPASSSVDYVISRREGAAIGEEKEIVIPEITGLINPLPESISVDNIRVVSTNQGYINIYSGAKYSATIDYEVYAPLAFDSGLLISYTQDIEDLSLEFEGMEIPSAMISMNLINTIPIGFSVKATALDSDGNIIEDISLSADKDIAPGSIQSPSDNKIAVSLKNKGGELMMSGLRVELSANSNAEYAGIPLNTAQGLEIKHLVFSLPDGINMSLNEN